MNGPSHNGLQSCFVYNSIAMQMSLADLPGPYFRKAQNLRLLRILIMVPTWRFQMSHDASYKPVATS